MFEVTSTGVIMLTRGDNASLDITVYDPDNNVYPLREDDTLTFTVKQNPNDETALIEKTGSSFDILPEDTNGLEFGTYYYDVQLEEGDHTVHTVIVPKKFVICKEVTW